MANQDRKLRSLSFPSLSFNKSIIFPPRSHKSLPDIKSTFHLSSTPFDSTIIHTGLLLARKTSKTSAKTYKKCIGIVTSTHFLVQTSEFPFDLIVSFPIQLLTLQCHLKHPLRFKIIGAPTAKSSLNDGSNLYSNHSTSMYSTTCRNSISFTWGRNLPEIPFIVNGWGSKFQVFTVKERGDWVKAIEIGLQMSLISNEGSTLLKELYEIHPSNKFCADCKKENPGTV